VNEGMDIIATLKKYEPGLLRVPGVTSV
jgi:hypothetical protein